MCKTVYKKIHSSVGASLAIALLLFLACTVVGTVVLTAASAVSGRAAELTFMDQRYHSVASAAALLEKELCGKDIKIERYKKTEVKKTIVYSGEDESAISTQTDYTVTYRTGINQSVEDQILHDDSAWPVKKELSDLNSSRSAAPTVDSSEGIELGKANEMLPGKSFLTTMAVNLLFGDSSDGSPGSGSILK